MDLHGMLFVGGRAEPYSCTRVLNLVNLVPRGCRRRVALMRIRLYCYLNLGITCTIVLILVSISIAAALLNRLTGRPEYSL
eukprot:SAG31_NODE_992_length_10517_cov_6.577942_13_plen_81_part_00